MAATLNPGADHPRGSWLKRLITLFDSGGSRNLSADPTAHPRQHAAPRHRSAFSPARRLHCVSHARPRSMVQRHAPPIQRERVVSYPYRKFAMGVISLATLVMAHERLPKVIVNLTPSVPVGVYLTSPEPITRGAIVMLNPADPSNNRMAPHRRRGQRQRHGRATCCRSPN